MRPDEKRNHKNAIISSGALSSPLQHEQSGEFTAKEK
jgi:hypothetical protein